MSNILTIDTANQLKGRFKRALPDSTPTDVAPIIAKEGPEQATSTGHALYMLYRIERTKQGWEEVKWSSLSDPQRLVWIRFGEVLTNQP